jgi:hypothetical protein
MELPMLARQWLGDVAFAVLLVLPIAVLAKVQPTSSDQLVSRFSAAAPATSHLPTGRISLLG